MTQSQYVQCIIASLIGMVIHVLAKFQALKKDYKVGNGIYTFKQFCKDDWIALSIDVTSCVGIIYVFDEWSGWTPWIISKMKTIFVFVGIGSSWIVMTIASKAKDKLRLYIDKKTGDGSHEVIK